MKRAITGIVAASLTLGTMAPAAFAATASAPQYFSGHVTLGSYSAGVTGVVATDAGNQTGFFPFYYVNQALSAAGYTVAWDGAHGKLSITTPSGVTPDFSNLNPGSGKAGIYINGTLVQNAPFVVAKDLGGKGATTSFMPIYYINQALGRVGFTNSYNAGSWTLTAPVAQLNVQSVSALNAAQIQVVFNKPIDASTAVIGNFKLNNTTLSGTDDASVSADNKTVTLTLNTSTKLTKTTGYNLQIDGVQSADDSQTISSYTSPAFSYTGDTTAATVSSISATASTSTTSVQVTYSEPVKGNGLYYIDGQPAGIASNSNGVVTLTAPTALKAGTTHSLQIVSEADTSDNLTTVTQSFTVVSDTAVPTASVQVVNDNTIRVTFSKKMLASTVNTSNIKVLNSAGAALGSPAIVAINTTAGDTTGKQYDISVTGAKSLFSNGTLPLGVEFTSAVSDTSGNVMALTTVPVTLTLNTAAPAVTSTQYVKPGSSYNSVPYTNGAVVLTFNENVTSATPAQTITAISDAGYVEPATFTGAFGATHNVVVLNPSAKLSGTTSETLQIPANAFTDTSNSGLSNATSTTTVNLGSDAGNLNDTSVPAVSAVNVASNAANSAATIQYTLTDADSNVNWLTVTNLADYRLNGLALPAGSYVTTTSSASPWTVTITLPAGSITTTGNYSLVINGIQDKGGNTAPQSATTLSLTANAAPSNVNTLLASNKTVAAGGTLSTDAVPAAGETVFLAPANTAAATLDAWTTNTATITGSTNSGLTAPTTPGTYYLYVKDAAGNVSAASTASVTVTTGPLATMTGLTYSSETGTAAAGGSFTVATAATGKDSAGNTVSATGGTYSISGTPATTLVSINSATGAVTVGAGATTGSYTITYTLNGVTTTATITVA